MAKYVPDVKTQRWVIISQIRAARPEDGAKKPKDTSSSLVCPFCNGSEHMTPPEVYRMGGGEKDKPGWLVRVVSNKFPITDVHEVFIHTPDHDNDLDALNVEQVTRVLTAHRDRYKLHSNDGQVLIFCNHGLHAGASLIHPHSQLVVVPRQINLDALSREPIANVVEDNLHFITYCPEFSQWPYEVWIAPKEEGTKFGDTRDEELPDLARILKGALQKIRRIHETSPIVTKQMPFGFNFYIHHGPNWFIRIIPRLVHRAGFELGTGLNVNIVDPTDAAAEFKKIKIEA